jgi:3-oxoadipate enol-lactonase
MPLIESFDGCRIAAHREGKADQPAVVLSHFLGGRMDTWDVLAGALSKHFTVVRFDTRGHGDSAAPDGPYTVEMLGRDALAVLDEFGLDAPAFIGLSQGAMTGMWLAAHHPRRVSSLVIANATPFIPNKAMWDQLIETTLTKGAADVAGPMVSSWLADEFKAREPAKTQAIVSAAANMAPNGFAGNCAVLRDVDLRSALTSIRCPTLIVAGAKDGARGAAAPVMAATIPRAKLITIPDAAHLTHLENPSVFVSCIKEFLLPLYTASQQ